MSKNKMIIIVISIIILVVIFGILIKNNNNKMKEQEKIQTKPKVESSYDEETGLYYVKDEKTGEIIGASQNEEDLEFYKENPDYNPNPLAPRSTSLQDFVSYGSDMYYEVNLEE